MTIFKSNIDGEHVIKWEDPYPAYRNCVDSVLDKNGQELSFHDVCRTSQGEILFIDIGVNHCKQLKGLIAVNKYAGFQDWLDTYPDGELEILGNVEFVYGEVYENDETV